MGRENRSLGRDPRTENRQNLETALKKVTFALMAGLGLNAAFNPEAARAANPEPAATQEVVTGVEVKQELNPTLIKMSLPFEDPVYSLQGVDGTRAFLQIDVDKDLLNSRHQEKINMEKMVEIGKKLLLQLADYYNKLIPEEQKNLQEATLIVSGIASGADRQAETDLDIGTETVDHNDDLSNNREAQGVKALEDALEQLIKESSISPELAEKINIEQKPGIELSYKTLSQEQVPGIGKAARGIAVKTELVILKPQPPLELTVLKKQLAPVEPSIVENNTFLGDNLGLELGIGVGGYMQGLEGEIMNRLMNREGSLNFGITWRPGGEKSEGRWVLNGGLILELDKQIEGYDPSVFQDPLNSIDAQIEAGFEAGVQYHSGKNAQGPGVELRVKNPAVLSTSHGFESPHQEPKVSFGFVVPIKKGEGYQVVFKTQVHGGKEIGHREDPLINSVGANAWLGVDFSPRYTKPNKGKNKKK